ncbi:MAG: AraC family transcriptional regulator [Clostridiaceae bacterium]|nr:AraC family transcriptional regulator [Clostridiaceae bacterium]
MMEVVPINRLNLTDINMYQCGTEKCKPGHFFGPAVRDYYLIHYIVDGKGIFQVGNTTYNLDKGQGFLIFPGIVTFYQADAENPWYYTWIGFNGLKAEEYLKKANLTMENPVFSYTKDDFVENCFREMIEIRRMEKAREIRLLGLFYMFISQLAETSSDFSQSNNLKNTKEQYINKMLEFIELNYSRKISISEMAKYIGLDRSYMGSIFKDYLKTTPQSYLTKFRMNKACELMSNQQLSIGDISRSVGYEDPLLFSKTFKKIKGLSPREYRKNTHIIKNKVQHSSQYGCECIL